ncbi:MAG: purine-nucleoside phosphorylase [Kiritimatiellia bacterium]|nr:purine-nucleoside phosphorylase [Kiritimatiellia bacterium]
MDRNRLAESAKIIRRHFKGCRPAGGLILGTGWETAIEAFTIKGRLPYTRLPVLGKTTVAGHAGVLLWAELSGIETFIFQGRHHWYEGLGWDPIALPIYILKKLGASVLVLTNSAGGMRPDLRRGMLMVIKDHINAMGVNPLHGKHDVFWGKRFVDQTAVYNPRLRALLKRIALRHDIQLKEGVYIGVAGPVYETPSEIKAFKILGADTVGMSTVPEAILANAAGLKVVGLSLIANAAAGLGHSSLDHEEVRRAGSEGGGKIKILVKEFWRAMAREKRL